MGLLSQVNDSGTVENNTSLETTDKTNIVPYGKNAVGVLACSSPGESRTCVDAVGNDSNLLIVFYVQIMPDDFVMQLHRF